MLNWRSLTWGANDFPAYKTLKTRSPPSVHRKCGGMIPSRNGKHFVRLRDSKSGPEMKTPDVRFELGKKRVFASSNSHSSQSGRSWCDLAFRFKTCRIVMWRMWAQRVRWVRISMLEKHFVMVHTETPYDPAFFLSYIGCLILFRTLSNLAHQKNILDKPLAKSAVFEHLRPRIFHCLTFQWSSVFNNFWIYRTDQFLLHGTSKWRRW